MACRILSQGRAPGGYPPGALLASIRRTGLPVALGAQPQDPRVLVRECVESCRLRNAVSVDERRTCVPLIQMGPGSFRREGQVLDGSPPGDETQLRNVVVGVAGGYSRTKCE